MDTKRETEKEKADALRWIIGAGIGAVGLATFAYSVDRYQESATARDRAHSEMLRELRVAQTTLPSRTTDDRLKVRIPMDAPRAAEPAPEAHDAHGHDEHGH